MLPHARVERSDAAKREKAVEWRAGQSETVRPPPELLAERGVASDDRATDDVAVAVQVFRRRVHDEIRAERDRLLEGGGEEGIVGDHQRADGVSGGGDASDVRDTQNRIARRFDPDEPRPPASDLRLGADRGEVDLHDVKMAA